VNPNQTAAADLIPEFMENQEAAELKAIADETSFFDDKSSFIAYESYSKGYDSSVELMKGMRQ